MSVPQAMEWLIEHSEDPAIDTPLPGHAAQAGASAAATTSSTSSEAAVGTSVEDEESRDELTEIFKKIRRKKEFRADARVCDGGLSMRLGLWVCCARKPGGLESVAVLIQAWGLGCSYIKSMLASRWLLPAQ
jgi:hypothetical protein